MGVDPWNTFGLNSFMEGISVFATGVMEIFRSFYVLPGVSLFSYFLMGMWGLVAIFLLQEFLDALKALTKKK